MLLLFYMILLILEPFVFFLVIYDCVTCDDDRSHTSVMYNIISYSLFIFKIKKSENEKLK